MEFGCREVLLVLCLTVLTWSDVKADDPCNSATNSASTCKTCRYFGVLDRNGDGKTDALDIAIIATLLGTMPPALTSNLIQRTAVLGQLALNGYPMTEKTTAGALATNTLSAFIEYVQSRASTGAIVDDYKVMVGMILGLFTADKKAVTRINFHYYFVAAGLNGCDETAAFNAIDTDKSGTLTYDELMVAVKMYFTSDDSEAPANLLFCWRPSVSPASS